MFARKPKSPEAHGRLADLNGKLEAIGRSQALIEFNQSLPGQEQS